jgi:uncharacterized protein YaaN involved in tellurite resistance
MQGIEQTKEIEETNRLSRQSNAAKLESMKYDMIKKNTR